MFLHLLSAFVLLSLAACSRGGGGEALQDRNGPCFRDSQCLAGLTCEGESWDKPGTCTLLCREDADCGNGFLCRDATCQKDCAEMGEKCSEKRVCCFFDEDADGKTDSACLDEKGDVRCRVKPRPVLKSGGAAE